MSPKKPTLGRGLADLLGQTLRPAAPVAPVAVHVPSAGATTNGTAHRSGSNASGNPAAATPSSSASAAAAASAGPASPPGSSAAAGTLDAANSAAPLASGEELARLPLDLLQKGKYQPRVDMRPET